MQAYVIRRLLQAVPVIILVTLMVFLLLHLTGDPIALMASGGEALDPQQREALRKELGLDKPILVQYGVWLGKVVQGDFGRSTKTQRLVTDELKVRLPVTAELGVISWVFSIIIALPAGVVSAVRRGSKVDILATVLTMAGVAIPGFWLGIMLILLFSVQLGWLPAFGFVSHFANPIDGFKHLVLPAFSLGLGAAALNMRQTRSAMLEVLSQDYIRTARAKGLHERAVIWVHAFKNASLPVVTLMGLQIGRLLGGAVIIERLFAIPGMGRLMVDSIFFADFPVVQACVLIVALCVVLANLATDLLYAYLDPRIRYA